MENENKGGESINPYKKSNDIVISKTLLKNMGIGLLLLICVFIVFTYFNSGLTHKKAKDVFVEYWNNENKENKLEEVKILGIKKIKTDIYWVKVSYSDWAHRIDWSQYGKNLDNETEEQRKIRIDEWDKKNPPVLVKNKKDYVYTKWDTGWFVERKIK